MAGPRGSPTSKEQQKEEREVTLGGETVKSIKTIRGYALPLVSKKEQLLYGLNVTDMATFNGQSTINFGSFDSQKHPFFNVILLLSCDLSSFLSFVHPSPTLLHVLSLDH